MSLDHVAAFRGPAPDGGVLSSRSSSSRPRRLAAGGAPVLGASMSAETWEAVHAVIEDTIAQVFGVTQADLSIKSRGKAHIALARQTGMYLAHVICGLTLTEVGLLFGRDRTTVAHACAVVEDRRDDPVFDRALDLLEWALPSLINPERRFALVIS